MNEDDVTGMLDAFAQGVIGGRTVPCLSMQQQLRFREGYELREVDRHDLEVLRLHAVEQRPSPGRGS